MAKKRLLFERGGHIRRKTRQTDLRGSIIVRVNLLSDGRYAKGNISRSFSVRHARVSDVAAAIERALFGEREAPP